MSSNSQNLPKIGRYTRDMTIPPLNKNSTKRINQSQTDDETVPSIESLIASVLVWLLLLTFI